LIVQKKNERKGPVMRSDFLFPNCFIAIFDVDFKHKGDVDFPDNIYSFTNLFITEKGIYISEDHVDNPTYTEDAMRFRLFKIKEMEDL
jgi:hypothetical protein